MRRKALQGLLAVFLGVFAAATFAAASQIHLTPMFRFGAESTDNVFFLPDVLAVSDFYYLVNPGVNLEYASSKAVVNLGFQAGFHRFNDYQIRDNDVYRLDAQVGFKATKKIGINIKENYIDTNDPLAFDASGDRLQRDSFWYNYLSPGVNVVMSRDKLMFSGAYERIDIDYDHLVDSVQQGVVGGGDYKIGRKTTFGGRFAYFERNFDPGPYVDDYTGQVIRFDITHALSTRTALDLYAGYEWRDFVNGYPSADYDSEIYGVKFTGEYPGALSFTTGFSQRLNDLTAKGVYRVRRFDMEVKKVVADRVTGTGEFFIQKAYNEQLGGERDDFMGFRALVEVLVVNFLTIDGGYEYLNRDSNILNDFTENKFLFGLTASYGI